MNPAENKNQWKLTGKPHWPLTTYEKLWGLWHLAGISLSLGTGFFLFFILTINFFPDFVVWLARQQPIWLLFVFAPIFSLIFLFVGMIGLIDWWQLIHGTIPDPAPWARIVAYSMNEPDPWKEHAELQARLDEAKKASQS